MSSKGKRTVAKERRSPGRHREGKRCRVRDDRGDPRVREKWSALWQWWLDNVIPPVSVRESGECRRAVANGWKATGPALLSINFQNGIWSLKSKIQCKWCQNYLKICKKIANNQRNIIARFEHMTWKLNIVEKLITPSLIFGIQTLTWVCIN